MIGQRNHPKLFAPNRGSSVPVRAVKAATPYLFQLIIKAQLEHKKACKNNADNKVHTCHNMRLAGDGDAERPESNQALEGKADSYMVQIKL